MSQKNYEEIRQTLKKYMLLIAALAIAMMVGSREVIMIVGGKNYQEGYGVFIPICIGIYALYMYTIPVAIEYYYKETKYIALCTGLSAILNIVLNFIFIPIFNYNGAAMTTLISHLFQFVIHWIISIRILRKNNVNKVFSLKDILTVFAAVVITGITVFFMNPYPLIKYAIFVTLFVLIAVKSKDTFIDAYRKFVKKGE